MLSTLAYTCRGPGAGSDSAIGTPAPYDRGDSEAQAGRPSTGLQVESLLRPPKQITNQLNRLNPAVPTQLLT